VIARTWKGTARPDRADAYVRHLREQTFERLATIPGFREAQVLRRQNGGIIEFTVITWWDSREAIGGFAGADPERAVVPLAAQALLASWDDRAVHWDVVLTG
jgi:heme-degrading monooxygenase HmoA